MILAIDIGNTDVVFGLWDDSKWAHTWRIPTIKDRQAEVYYELRIRNCLLEFQLESDKVDKIIMSSVVPDLNPILENDMYHIFNKPCILLSPEIYEAVHMKVPRPHEIGSDLAANAYGAWKLYDANVIIVDFGTALTYTAINKHGEIQGVSIAPGIKTAIQALSNNTAQLPVVPLEVPSSPLGKDTVHAIQAGILCGYTGMVNHMISRIRAELGEDYIVVATGGLSSILFSLKDSFKEINKRLTLDGLRLIAEQLS